MGPGLGTNNEQLIGTLSSSALGQTHQYKQGLYWEESPTTYMAKYGDTLPFLPKKRVSKMT